MVECFTVFPSIRNPYMFKCLSDDKKMFNICTSRETAEVICHAT